MTLDEQFAFMRSGGMYNDLTPELIEARQHAVLRTNAYNASFGETQAAREALLRQVLGRIGEGVHFEPVLRCEFGRNITIGNRFYGNFDCVMLDAASIDIGDDVLFGPRVGIYTANHAIDPEERARGGCYARPVRIGSRVWIGGGVQINQGVSIGDGAIIGSGSVVTKDVPPMVIAAGAPCRVLRPVTDKDRTGFRP